MKLFLAVLVTVLLSATLRAEESYLPNPKLTPGRVARNDQDRAGVTLAMEQKVFARYRLPWDWRAQFKIDHLVPLELGGADTIDNLWPQRIRAKPYSAERKELLTALLVQKVRAGKMTLGQAQEEIRRDWIDAFVDHLGFVYLRPGNLMAD